MGTDAVVGRERCAAHPGRPAAGRCPVCDRPRCGRDVRPDGCAVCLRRRRSGRGPAEAVARAGVVLAPIAVLSAAIGQEYVGTRVLSVLVPALGALVLGLAAAGAARRRAVAVPAAGGYAALATLLSFRFTDLPYGPPGRWLPPLAAAVLVALAAAAAGQERKDSSETPPR